MATALRRAALGLHSVSRRLLSTAATSVSPAPQTDLISHLESRGLIQHLTSRALRTHLSSGPRVVYSGVDPSASSLHVGNLLPLLTLAHFARYNHTPIILVGGATGSIGDPSGRSTERNALSPQTLHHNVTGIQLQLHSFFQNVKSYYHNNAVSEVKMMNNLDWTHSLSLLDFLSSVGRHARITQMLARDSVSSRLEKGGEGLSYTEFSYQLLQAYDFSYLHSNHNCTIQIGGSDQLGNITAGIDLIRRTNGLSEDPAYGLTLPLLTTSGGEKFGKSAGNAVWLDRGKTADLEFYQFFLRSTDADVGRYLRCLTLLELEEIETVMERHKGKERERTAQKVLADHLTELIRGKAAVEKCQMLTSILFADDKREALTRLDVGTLDEEDHILAKVGKDEVVGTDITRVLVKAELVKSRGEAKRLVSGGGVYVNNRQIKSDDGIREDDLINPSGARGGGAGGALCLLRAGKGAIRVLHIT